MTKFRVVWLVAVVAVVLGCLRSPRAQPSDRTKVAEGEYRVTTEGDLGVGPIQTGVFHFSETWSLWRTAAGYEVEGHRIYESPRGEPHDDRFTAELKPDLQLLSIKEFRHLTFRRDSGPLSCDLLAHLLRCDSGGTERVQHVKAQVAMDQPYAVIWPLSAFSLASLTRAASIQGTAVVIQLVQMEEVSERLPVLAIRSDGRIQYMGKGQTRFVLSENGWHPNVYELTAGPVGKMTLWTSQEGLLLAAQVTTWPEARLELVKFTKFADF